MTPATGRAVLATRNPHKVLELQRILGSVGGDLAGIDLVGIDEVGSVPDVAETGATFEENALLKATAVARATGLVAIADDSGLVVDALNGMPGVLSARWSGRDATDERNLLLVLDQLADVPDGRRGAAFVCAAAAATPDGGTVVAAGRVDGSIVRQPRGANGFGYDPIFVPAGEARTTAEMSAEEKDAISHRGKAFRALAEILPGLLGQRSR